MAGSTAGTSTPRKRCANDAPRLRAASSSATSSWRRSAEPTMRTMKGRVNTTWPTRMKAKLWRKAATLP